jgi:hypothetical protein
MKEAGKSLALLSATMLLWLAIAEGVCRLLPVNSGIEVLPVDAANPIIRFQPNRDYVYSHGSLLRDVNRGHVNNFGFVNDQNYDPDDARPLLAVIGDSYIQASMVPYPLTLQGRLAARQQGHRRVYSFASSGSSLLDYLYYAAYARRRFHAEWLVINIVGNDFDEMLLRYKQASAFHYLTEQPDGSLQPILLDYHPGSGRFLLRHSALARYLVFNIGSSAPWMSDLLAWLHRLRLRLSQPVSAAHAATPEFVGNAASEADPLRVELSQRATFWVLDHLPDSVGLPPSHMLILMDGYRVFEPEQLEAERGSFFGIMREFLIPEARRRGYEVQDMQEWFLRRHRRDGAVFDFPDDAHWSALGHEEAANAVLASELYRRFSGAEERWEPSPPR